MENINIAMPAIDQSVGRSIALAETISPISHQR